VQRPRGGITPAAAFLWFDGGAAWWYTGSRMRIFKNKSFSRFARKEAISDDDLKKILPQLEANLPDADLGGDVYKMRVPREGEGKSGGYRVIVLFRRGERTFFVHGFAKSDLSNIIDKRVRGFKDMAKDMMLFTEKELDVAIKFGKLKEIPEEKHEEISR
jgi:hypothetical protein